MLYSASAERQQLPEELLSERNLLRMLIDVLPDQIYVKDRHSRYLLVNQSSLHGLGGARMEDVLGKTDADFFPSETAELFYRQEQALMDSGEPIFGREVASLDENGESIWLLVTQVPLRDRQGNIVGFVGVNRDITERKWWEEELETHRNRLEDLVRERTEKLLGANEDLQQEVAERKQVEEALQQARIVAEQANQAKSEFLANTSHELRTPLNGILGYAQILSQRTDLDDKVREGVSIIYQSGSHLLTLINDILDLAKIEAGRTELAPADFFLPTFLEGILGMVQLRARQKDVLFVADIATDLPNGVVADEKRLRQVLLNLLQNAIKFTPQGTVTLRVTSHGKCQVTPMGDCQHLLRFAVSDTGVGMTAEQLGKIFRPFEQVGDLRQRAEGAGLGLAISRKLVQLMGGDLRVESAMGQGTTFWFEIALPVSAIEAASLARDRNIMGYEGPRQNILIVEDEECDRLILQQILEPLDFNLRFALNGHQALERVAAARPQLIVMDMILPEMMGDEAIRRIRARPDGAALKIIGVSASVYNDEIQKFQAAGCDVFLAKPLNVKQLLDTVRDLLALTWAYSDPAGLKRPETVAVDQWGHIEKHLTAQEMQELLTLAKIGDMRGIRKQATLLREQKPAVTRFTETIEQFARDYEEKQLLDLLERSVF